MFKDAAVEFLKFLVTGSDLGGLHD